MNREELLWFRDNVHIPKMQQLLQNTTVPEGYCVIVDLDVSILDGRNCGVDSELKAQGFVYKEGKVEPYSFETLDFEETDFFEKHKSSVFLEDGKLHVWDELRQMDVHTILGNLRICSELFHELKPAATMTVERTPLEYLKMKQILEDTKKAELNAKIQSILAKREDHPSIKKSAQQKDEFDR